MKSEKLCGLRNIARAIREHALNVLPFDSGETGSVGAGHWGGFWTSPIHEFLIARKNLVGVRGFAEIVIGSEFYCRKSRRDAAVSGQHDDADGLIKAAKVAHDLEPAYAGEPKIYNRQVRTQRFGEPKRCGAIGGSFSLPSATRQGATQTIPKYFVVIDD